jgi:hypothetical protein
MSMDYPDPHTVFPLIERLGWVAVEIPGATGSAGTSQFTAMPLADLQRARDTGGEAEGAGAPAGPGPAVPRLEGRGATREEALYKLYRAICSYTGAPPAV